MRQTDRQTDRQTNRQTDSRIKTSRHRFKDNKDINIEQKPEVEKKLGDNVTVGHKLGGSGIVGQTQGDRGQ